MAMNGLQPMPLFEPKADPTNTSVRWTQWIQRFNTYLVASNVKDTARKRALLLYQAGPEVHEIFKTLPDTCLTQETRKITKLLSMPSLHILKFEPEKNRIYQTYMFKQASQQDNETIDEFHTRLRRLAKHCEFVDVEFEIKMQIVCNGTSSRLRKKALKESNYSLKDMLSMVENQKPAVHKPVAWKKNLRMYNLIKLRENLLNLSAITVDLLRGGPLENFCSNFFFFPKIVGERGGGR